MKSLKNLIILLILLSGCRFNTAIYHQIEKAEKNVNNSPEMAASIIDSLNIDYNQLSKEWQSRLVLLKCSIAYKMKTEYPFLNEVMDTKEWFEKKGQLTKAVQASLFLAICLENENNDKAAHREYIDALIKADQNNDFNEAGYLSSHLANFYNSENDPNAALQKYDQASRYFLLADNKRSFGYALRDIGRTYCMIDSVSKAFEYMQRADSVADRISDKRLKSSVRNGLGNIALREGNYENAIMYLEDAIRIDSTGCIPNMLAISDIYMASGEYSKARLLLDTLFTHELSEEYKSGIYYNYYLINTLENNSEEALRYFEVFFDLFEKGLNSRTDANYIEVEKKYNHYFMVSEIQELTIKNQRFLIVMIILILVILFTISVFQYIHLKNKKKIFFQEEQLKETRITILNLSYELEKKNFELNEAIGEEYQKKEDEIKMLQEKIVEIKTNLLIHSPLKKDLLKKINSNKYLSKTIITNKIWSKIETEIDTFSPNFQLYLRKKYPLLTEQEIQYCCLCLYGFDSNQEAMLIGISPESIRKRRTRIREKMNVSLVNFNLYIYLREHLF
jgi:tetratricopeptide (TPR) repeat protein